LRRLPASASAVLLLFVASHACRRAAEPDLIRKSQLNILLITIDTLRADAVGAYGRGGGITPWIDRLAASGARFSNAHAHNVVTLPSHVNLLSGLLPSQHGVHDNSGFRVPATIETLPRLLKSHGYDTGAFVSAFPVESRFGLARGFDVYDDRFTSAETPAFLVQQRSGRDTVAGARRWLDQPRARAWFCWIHIYEPHFPYASPAPFASRFADPYYGEVAAADDALAPVLEPILKAGRQGRTFVVLTSDHGEALGDHGESTHGVFAYEATLKVPLVVFDPRSRGPVVVDEAARHVDVLPTILDAVGVPQPSGLSGHSLLPAVNGAKPADASRTDATYFESLSASLNRGWAPLEGVIEGSMKYIDLPIPELYDLRTDPREERNLASSQPERVRELKTELQQLRGSRSNVSSASETADTRERLRSLGYVASGRRHLPSRITEADDPKKLIGLDTRLQEVMGLYLRGDLPGALTACRELVRQRPDMALSLFYLAHLERESGDLESAVRTLKKAVALAPENTEAVALLGAYLTQAGHASEAVELLDRVNGDDIEVMTSRALALARLGRSQDALATLARARDLDPSNAQLLTQTGTVQLMAGDPVRAREAFESALRADPSLARAHSSLGALDIEDRRAAEAIAHWRAATTLDPREFETVLALGVSLARRGRAAEARAALEFFVANAPASRYANEIGRARAVVATLK
jgi:arylsulfatase A-like enzyme/Flp pilus assembly protein TadD